MTLPFNSGSSGVASDRGVVVRPGQDLSAAYARACELKPGGAALSATNRAAVLLHTGTYTLTSTLELDTDYVDLIGLNYVCGKATMPFEDVGDTNETAHPGNIVLTSALETGTVLQTATDIRMVGLSIINTYVNATASSTKGGGLRIECPSTALCYRYDESETAYTAITAGGAGLEGTPGDDDAIYFGFADSEFSGVRVKANGAAVNSGDAWVWEYYNGSSWAALTVVYDNSSYMAPLTGAKSFEKQDGALVLWNVPTDWDAVEVNSVEAFWVRARLDTASNVRSAFTFVDAPTIAGHAGAQTANANSLYMDCYFYQSSTVRTGKFSSGVLSDTEINGTWLRCYGNRECWCPAFGGILSGRFVECIGSPGAFGNDGTSGISGEFIRCQTHGILNAGESDGAASFGGCGTYGLPANNKATFRECVAADTSYNLNRPTYAVYDRCVGGDCSFGGSASSTGVVSKFGGAAYNCRARGASFGGRGSCAGTLHNCRVDTAGLAAAYREGLLLTGAELTNCYIATGSNNVPPITLLDSNSVLRGCTLLAHGTGNSIYAGSALNVKAVHCHGNTALSVNVTNIAPTTIVVLDRIPVQTTGAATGVSTTYSDGLMRAEIAATITIADGAGTSIKLAGLSDGTYYMDVLSYEVAVNGDAELTNGNLPMSIGFDANTDADLSDGDEANILASTDIAITSTEGSISGTDSALGFDAASSDGIYLNFADANNLIDGTPGSSVIAVTGTIVLGIRKID